MAKRKRHNILSHAGPSLDIKRAARSRLLNRQPETAGGLRGLQEALEEAGLTEQVIARRTERTAKEDSQSIQMSELMKRRERLIAEWRGRVPAAEEHEGAAVRWPKLASREGRVRRRHSDLAYLLAAVRSQG